MTIMDKNLNIETRRTATLDAATRQEIVTLCTTAHKEDFSPLFSLLPSDGLHIMAYFGEIMVGHAVVTTRWLQPESLPLLRTAYIDAVSTLPEYQGRGYGSAVMRHLAGIITMDYEIACLETEKVAFYSRLGWQLWRGPLAGRGDDGLVPTPDQEGIMILRLPRTPELDMDSLLTIECQATRIW